MTRFIEFTTTQNTKVSVGIDSITALESDSNHTGGTNIVISGRDKSIAVVHSYDQVLNTLEFARKSNSFIISCPGNSDPNGVTFTNHNFK